MKAGAVDPDLYSHTSKYIAHLTIEREGSAPCFLSCLGLPTSAGLLLPQLAEIHHRNQIRYETLRQTVNYNGGTNGPNCQVPLRTDLFE